jgi:hypothetical protein
MGWATTLFEQASAQIRLEIKCAFFIVYLLMRHNVQADAAAPPGWVRNTFIPLFSV